MLPRITTKIKDNTLLWLCDNVGVSRNTHIDLSALLNHAGVDFDTMNGLLMDFQDTGLLEITILRRNAAFLSLKVKAHDLVNNGGFAVIDALNEANIQKILFELENLQKQLRTEQPDRLETLNKVTTIAASLATVLAAFTGKS